MQSNRRRPPTTAFEGKLLGDRGGKIFGKVAESYRYILCDIGDHPEGVFSRWYLVFGFWYLVDGDSGFGYCELL